MDVNQLHLYCIYIDVDLQSLHMQLWLAAGSDDSLVSTYTWEKKR